VQHSYARAVIAELCVDAGMQMCLFVCVCMFKRLFVCIHTGLIVNVCI